MLVEDSVLLREGLVRLFDEAATRPPAPGATPTTCSPRSSDRADLAVLDVRMPPTFRDEGVRAALELRAELPDVGILLLSQYVEGVYAHELLAAATAASATC